MGYSQEFFLDSNLNEEFICLICHGILKDPVMIQNCEHIFCNSCILSWSSTTPATCPMDRNIINVNTQLKSPPRVFINLLNSLKRRCEFINLGCNEVIELGDTKSHEATCEFNPEFKKECASGCGAFLRNMDIDSHNCIGFLKTSLVEMETQVKNLKIQVQDKEKEKREEILELKCDVEMLKAQFQSLEELIGCPIDSRIQDQIRHICIEALNKYFPTSITTTHENDLQTFNRSLWISHSSNNDRSSEQPISHCSFLPAPQKEKKPHPVQIAMSRLERQWSLPPAIAHGRQRRHSPQELYNGDDDNVYAQGVAGIDGRIPKAQAAIQKHLKITFGGNWSCRLNRNVEEETMQQLQANPLKNPCLYQLSYGLWKVMIRKTN